MVKSNYYVHHVCLSVSQSVHQHGTTRLPLDGFLCNVIFENSSKICPESSNSIKIREE